MKVILVTSLILRTVQRQIGLHQHGVCPRGPGGIRADADADGNVNLAAVDDIRQRQRGLDLGGKRAGIGGLRHLALNDGKFIAAQARDQVAFAGATFEALRDLLQQ